MEVLPLLVVVSLVVIAIAAWLFFGMSESGQFDDSEGPARKILLDDDRPSGTASASMPHATKRP